MEWNNWVGLGGLLIAAITLLLTGKRDTKTDAMELAKVQVLLTTINNGVDSLRTEVSRQRDQVGGLIREVTRLSEAHNALVRRVDRLEDACKLHREE